MRTGPLAALLTVALVSGCGGSSSGSSSNPRVAHQKIKRTYVVPSSAMEPTLHCARPDPGCTAAVSDSVVVDGYGNDQPDRRDIVVFKTPPKATQKCGVGGTFVKRLIGLPGETLQEKNGFIYINGRKLDEPYIKPAYRDTLTAGPWQVPAAQYFFMGDNRAQSCDSRQWGSVPRANIIGRVTKIERPR